MHEFFFKKRLPGFGWFIPEGVIGFRVVGRYLKHSGFARKGGCSDREEAVTGRCEEVRVSQLRLCVFH
jgi:hypothetical protein